MQTFAFEHFLPLMYIDDHTLWQAVVQSHDRKAFEQLFHRHYDSLRAYAYRIVGSDELAEEVVCDVMVKLWSKRHSLTLYSTLKAYLLRATRNQAIDYLRRQAQLPYTYEAGGIDQDHVPSPEEEIIFSETRGRLHEAIAALPPQGQHIFRLSRDEGLKYREIAEQLNISIKTVETHMRRSLIFLRREMALRS